VLRRYFTVVLVAGLVAACASAGGDATGGQLTPAGQQAETPAEFTPPAVVDCTKTTPTWTSLYADMFGATAKAGSCVYESFCHGPGGDQNRESLQKGIHCFDKDTCWQSLKNEGMIDNLNGVENAGIFSLLRTDNNPTGIMPQQPATYHVAQPCLTQITAWIAAGAANN
jgi:hypothetical protein